MAIKNSSNSFTRPADTTAYASGDLVANSTTAGSVVAVSIGNVAFNDQGSAIIRRVALRKSGTSTTSASFRVHLFKAAPSTVTNGDNGAFSVSGVADYIGACDVTVGQAFTDGAIGFGVPNTGSEFMVRLAGGSAQKIYALIEARAAYTPSSAEVFTLVVDNVDE